LFDRQQGDEVFASDFLMLELLGDDQTAQRRGRHRAAGEAEFGRDLKP
jgi:hypothetical protein